MTSCDRYQAQISSLIDGELHPAEQRALAEHIRTCRECRRMYTAFRGVSSVIADAAVEPPADLTARIMRQVREAPPIATAPRAAARPTAPQARQPVRRSVQQPGRAAQQPARRPQRKPVQQMPRQPVPEAEPPKRKKGRVSPLLPIGTIAACLVLIVGAIALFGPSGNKTHTGSDTLSGPKVSHSSASPTPDQTQSSSRVDETDPDLVSALPEDADCVVLSVPEEAVEPTNEKNELKLTDPETIHSLSALLVSDTETDPVPDSTKPACVLQDSETPEAQYACTVWLIGRDVVFRSGENGPYYLVRDAANTFRTLLNLPAN